MKKELCLLLSIVLLLSLSVPAFAVEDDYSWDFYGPIAEESFEDSAHFVRLEEVDAKIWIPDYLMATELTEEDLANDAIACFMSPDESEMVYITYSNFDGLSLEAFQRSLSNGGISAEIKMINGIPALLYYAAESDTFVVTYATVDGFFLQLLFFPLSGELSSILFTLILSSIQPDVEEVEEIVPVVPVNPVSGLISK